MQVTPLDILLAHKVINLSTALSNSDKRVAGTLLDHFNRKTDQCDPGQETVAELIGMSRRTVIRSVERLVRLGLFRKIRHGGKFHRNKYEPVWPAFRNLDAAWMARRKARQQTRAASNVSHCEDHSSHSAGDTSVHQTCITNQSKETSRVGSSKEGRGKNSPVLARPLAPSSRIATRDSAERRWNGDLLSRYAGQPVLLGHIVESIDGDLISSTTDMEQRQRGAGLAYLIGEIEARERAFGSEDGVSSSQCERRTNDS
ncbi:MAG: helix-turn-helix domain-containing protein [Candidatus Latescibacteria bacterium]|nr:helix-turn-helix domain-containing protein [Candidatus Latescibacterota bacterium]